MKRGRATREGVDTYIVRVYRRATDSAEAPAGTVECVGCGELVGFTGRDQLWERLFSEVPHVHGDKPGGTGCDPAEGR